MIKRLLIMLVIVGLIFGGIFGFISFKAKMIKQYMASMGNASQTVSTTVASYQDWSSNLDAVGSLAPVQGADLSAEVSGIVTEIFFQQGDDVVAGSPLVQLKADDDIAKLKSLKAVEELARLTYQRNQAQLLAKAISQQIVDSNKADLTRASANVAEQQALVNKKLIRAPFSGRLGIRTVNLGQYLNAGTSIVTLQALNTLYVDFFLPQQDLAKIAIGQTVEVHIDAYPSQKFMGKVVVINPKVDANTRNVQIRAVLDNAKHQLLAGMYANVKVVTDSAQRALTLPNTVISFNSYGSTVFLIETNKDEQGKEKRTAKQVFVTTGATRGDQVAILKGIKEGDTVVTSGQLKLRNGSVVLINNTVQPSNEANPQPNDL
ncbi:MAG: efflux RND transporter periplasmic adaptor subunit [Methylococcales bacterium]|nr:efflux RND transporter periplasmic adaptor subunit [Methylococcales bacterium]